MNNDLISRKALLDVLSREIDFGRKHPDTITAISAFKIAYSRTKGIPAVDAEPVRHGEWREINVPKKYGGIIIRCSECNTKGTRMWNYCPNCGAKMEKG